MFRLADDLRVYLHREPIDFRAGINSLAILVEQSMGLNPVRAGGVCLLQSPPYPDEIASF
ncbi:IS66 family insertion sequence element accessory protein TnpB [Rhizobium beringeri]